MKKNIYRIKSLGETIKTGFSFIGCKIAFILCLILFSACQTDEMDGETQKQLKFYLNGDLVESVIPEATKSEFTLVVESKNSWSLTCQEEWIKTSITTGEAGNTPIVVTVDENSGGDARVAKLLFAMKNGATESLSIAQSGSLDPVGSDEYRFYVTFGTIPTLYSGLHLLSHDGPSFFGYERTGTFDPSFFPSHVSYIPGSDNPEDLLVMGEVMKKEILKINNRDKEAKFVLYVDDLRCRLGYDWFVAQGIDSSRVEVNMWSDGTATYNNFYNFFGSNSNAESSWNRIATEVEALNWNTSVQTRGVPAEFNSSEWPYYMSTLPNYRLLLHDKNLLETESSFIQSKVAEMNAVSVSPEEMLKALSPGNQQRFFKMCNFDKAHYSEMFDVSAKPNLVIIGTNGNAEQQNYVKRVYDQYAGTHDIFYKPHPADATCAEYETLFPGLKLLPGRMPFEVFVWSLMDQIEVLGGFESTVFLTVPVNKVKFILGKSNASELIKPLNKMFENASVEYIH
ncbi:MAG: BACON domain-containing protein [Bacteroidales bacterium]